MADRIALIVAGRRYEGFETIRVTRSIESLAGSFELGVSDRWGDTHEPWPIVEEDPCRVEINGQTVIDGYVDKRSISVQAQARTLTFTGRDRAAALVDNSLALHKWTFRDMTLAEFATTIAKPFGLKVSVQSGLTLPKRKKIVTEPGDKAYEALSREAAEDGVLVVSDGAGGLLITRSNKVRAASLVEKRNILSASVDYDGADRYRRYVLATQTAGTDESAGEATRIQAEATDEGVRRTDRVLFIRTDKGYSVADARRRADWEARIRAAKAETVSIGVQGWTQPGGALWPINAETHVQAPALIGVDGVMLISQVDHSISNGGQVTTLRLVRPDAFTPEPKATVKKGGASTGWKELKEGGL